MKTTFIIILFAILLIIGGCVAYNDCSDNRFDLEITVALDRTGSHSFALPDMTTIKQAFQDDRKLWEGYNYRLVSLSDVSLNHVYEVAIKPECEYTSNVYQRKKRMEEFSAGLEDAMDKLLSEPQSRPSSSLYLAIAKELSRLSESSTKKKRLVIYSDLVEESALFRFTDRKTLAQLKENPDSIATFLNREFELPSLGGIEIYLVYQPVESGDSERYRIISNFYKSMFEGKGAKVFIGANLILQ